MRRTLVLGSLALHILVVAVVLVAGAWRIDRLDPPRLAFDLAVAMPPPPAPSGAPAATPQAPLTPKHPHITHDLVVPTHKPPTAETPATPDPDPDGAGSGSARGPGDGPGDPTDTGTCNEPPCGPPGNQPPADPPKPAQPPTPPPGPTLISPVVMRGLRVSGDTQLEPPDVTKVEIARSGTSRVVAALKICLSATGTIDGVSVVKSSGYSAYDRRLVDGVRDWRYRPYLVDGRATAVCSAVTFIYTMK